MVVHTFGAYFGLAVAWVNYKKEVEEADEKEGSVYHSDLFSIIGGQRNDGLHTYIYTYI